MLSFVRSFAYFSSSRKAYFLSSKMAAKYPISDTSSDSTDVLNCGFDLGSEFELDLGLSDHDRECIADWSRCGDDPLLEAPSTVAVHPSSSDIPIAIPPPPPSSPQPPLPPAIPPPPPPPMEINRPLSAAESNVRDALEIAGYTFDQCKKIENV